MDSFYRRREFYDANYPSNKLFRELKNSCPVCGYLTLHDRGQYDICGICCWEDDGVDDVDAERLSGPNHMTLIEGREIFLEAKQKLMASHFPVDSFKYTIQNTFLKLDALIEGNDSTQKKHVLQLQDDIIAILATHNIYLEDLFK